MAKKFDFLSPGIEIREIDQSFIPAQVDADGPIIIGRTRKGPANKPVKVRNLDDFVSVFGLPIAGGNGAYGDMWRDGNMTGPTYASYAAQSWLASDESPVTVVRLAGEQHPQAATDAAKAGWSLSGSLSSDDALNSTAYGLFLVESGSTGYGTGSLAAVFYANKGYLTLDGTDHAGNTDTKEAGTFIENVDVNCKFKLAIWDENGRQVGSSVTFDFGRNSSNYIRSVFNTNPQLVNEDTIEEAQRKTYWLGESFTRELDNLSLLEKTAGNVHGLLLPLQSGSINWSYHKEGAAEAQTGWVISQKSKNQEDLFRFKCLHTGEDIQKDYLIAIEQIAEATNPNVDPYGTFTVSIKSISGNTIERYVGCNLNPSSPNYLGRRIGDQYMEWSETDRRYRTLGDYQNQSNIVYVDIKSFIKNGGGQGFLPAGFKGPVRPVGFTLSSGSVGAQAFGTTNPGTYTKAKTVITFGAANSDIPSNGESLTINILGTTRTVNFVNSGGTESAFQSDNELDIDITVDTTANNISDALKTALDALSIADVTITRDDNSGVSDTITIESDIIGDDYVITSDATGATNITSANTAGVDDSNDLAGAFVKGNLSAPEMGGDANNFVSGPAAFTASFNFPSIALRAAGTDGGAPDPYRAYYGVRPALSNTSTQHDPDYCDYLRRLPAGVNSFAPSNTTDFEHSFVFTLDDIKIDTTTNVVTYESGSYDETGSDQSYAASASFGALLDKNVRQFLMPLHGGSEGFDITEKDPFRDDLLGTVRSDVTNHLQYTINKALDSVRDPEVVPANLLLVPGIRKPLITDRVIAIAEDRKDVLGIIDLENDYLPAVERDTDDSDSDSLGNVASAVSSLKNRNLNSSYACAFYPWVQISDNLNSSKLVWIPPSIAALGAFGKSQASSELWFAPAGFNRGGLGNLGGARGPKVIQARQRLDSKERDLLYEVNINPIATFPAEGVVIFGQKTLQSDQSALDRINVRRLVLYLKAQVSNVARNLLFDQNVQSTWNRFKSQVNPILSDTRARFGLSDYKLILDDTTTTADLIDRNIMYAKIYIKPARAIEYIVVDFVITRTGADFV